MTTPSASWVLVCLLIGTMPVLVAGCTESYASDVEHLCDVARTCPEASKADMGQAEKQVKLSRCLESAIRTERGKKLLAALSSPGLSAGERSKVLRTAADEAGVKSCPDADKSARP